MAGQGPRPPRCSRAASAPAGRRRGVRRPAAPRQGGRRVAPGEDLDQPGRATAAVGPANSAVTPRAGRFAAESGSSSGCGSDRCQQPGERPPFPVGPAKLGRGDADHRRSTRVACELEGVETRLDPAGLGGQPGDGDRPGAGLDANDQASCSDRQRTGLPAGRCRTLRRPPPCICAGRCRKANGIERPPLPAPFPGRNHRSRSPWGTSGGDGPRCPVGRGRAGGHAAQMPARLATWRRIDGLESLGWKHTACRDAGHRRRHAPEHRVAGEAPGKRGVGLLLESRGAAGGRLR